MCPRLLRALMDMGYIAKADGLTMGRGEGGRGGGGMGYREVWCVRYVVVWFCMAISLVRMGGTLLRRSKSKGVDRWTLHGA